MNPLSPIEVVTADADTRISALSQQFTRIKAAVAYWCYPHQRLNASFALGVSAPGGFLCCDYHLPTSITVLAELKQAGGNVFLHLFNLAGRTEVPDSKGVPDNLMHSKVLIFERDDQDQCAIWVGSHNGTARALLGINLECALLVRTTKHSGLYRAVDQHLQTIRSRCTEFDLHDLDYYRSLQQQPEGVAICIEVYTPGGLQPGIGEEVTLFGSNAQDFSLLRNVDREGVLSVTDQASGVEWLFNVQITQSGHLNPKKPSTVSLSPRRFAFHENSLPELMPPGPVPIDVYRGAVFFVTLRIEGRMVDKMAVELPPRDQWVSVPLAAFMDRDTPEGARIPDSNALPSGRAVSIQRARSRNDPDLPAVLRREFEVASVALSLSDRAALPRRSMVRRRLLKPTSES